MPRHHVGTTGVTGGHDGRQFAGFRYSLCTALIMLPDVNYCGDSSDLSYWASYAPSMVLIGLHKLCQSSLITTLKGLNYY